MLRHLRYFFVLALAAPLAACTPSEQNNATPVASGPTVIVVTATPEPPTAVPPTAVPPTAVPPTAVPPTAVPPTAVPEPHGIEQRVEFAPGNVFARAEGAVVRGTRDRYILNARGGQYMHIALQSLENNAVFSVFAPNGQVLPGTEEGADVSNWSGSLPADGDYVVSIGATRGNASYGVKFTITNGSPQAVVGTITGRLNYPSEFIPSQFVYAVRVDDPNFFYLVQTSDGDSGYVFNNILPGNYYLLAYPSLQLDGTLRSGHTEYVRCGAKVECADHSLVQVTVTANQTTGGVDITDWYTPGLPERPQGSPQS